MESTLKHGVDPAPCLERNAGRRRRLGAAAGDLHDLGEVAAHVDEARRVGDVGVAEIEVGFVAVGGKRAGPARKKLLGNALPAGLVVFEYIHGHVAARRAEQPHPRFLLRLAVRLFQDLNRGLIGMNPDMRQQLDLHSLMDLRQPARVHCLCSISCCGFSHDDFSGLGRACRPRNGLNWMVLVSPPERTGKDYDQHAPSTVYPSFAAKRGIRRVDRAENTCQRADGA